MSWQSHLEPVPGDFIGEILAALDRVVRGELLSRLRVCGREGCKLVFYDSTRSRTARWCTAACGNRVHVAAHRERVRR